MTGARGRWLAVSCGLLVGTTGCTRDDTTKLERIGRLLARKAETAAAGGGSSPGWGLPVMPAALESAGLEGRVRQRIQSDKLIGRLNIEVRAAGAQVELRGRVGDLTQRRRAVEMAESTVGVESVVDRLEEPAK
jgi:BON domain